MKQKISKEKRNLILAITAAVLALTLLIVAISLATCNARPAGGDGEETQTAENQTTTSDPEQTTVEQTTSDDGGQTAEPGDTTTTSGGIADELSEYMKKVKELYGTKPEPGIYTAGRISDIARLCVYSANDETIGPIGMVDAVLKQNGVETDVKLIFLGGTEFQDGQATGINEDILSAFGKDNEFLKATVKAIEENVEKGTKLVFVGYSLGGMVAQQVINTASIKDNYEILYTTTIGSPLIDPTGREGTVRRMEDVNDSVPKMSLAYFVLSPLYKADVASEDGGYGGKTTSALYAHTFSYVEYEGWNKYDVLGIEGGDATLTYDNRTYVF